MKNINTMDQIDELLHRKSELVGVLIDILESTVDPEIRRKAALSLVDNFKDERIVPTLMNLIRRTDLKNHNAILVFALGEYSNCDNYIEYLVDLVLNYDYHVAWNSYSIIKDLIPGFEEEVVANVLKKLRTAKIDSTKRELIEALITFFDEIDRSIKEMG